MCVCVCVFGELRAEGKMEKSGGAKRGSDGVRIACREVQQNLGYEDNTSFAEEI